VEKSPFSGHQATSVAIEPHGFNLRRRSAHRASTAYQKTHPH
jgi:hypothetical protein